jgi:hypothetical protein
MGPGDLKNPLTSDQFGGLILDIDTLSSKMLAQFGQSELMAKSMRTALADSLDAIQDMGGTLEEAAALQMNVTNSLGRSVVLSAEGAKDLYASYKVTNIEVGRMVNSMADIGVSAYDTASQMKKIVDISRESGVNAQAVSDKVVTNMNVINKFNFEGGVSGLAKMAAQATMLRIDMKQTLDFADKVYNPEDAIETAAALQRLGVAQGDLLDPLKLMDLSQNDPAELQNQIAQMSKQFVKLKEDGSGFEVMKGAKRQFQEIAKAMNIPYETLTKMAIGSADLDKKMKEISFPTSFGSEEDRKLIANMAEMKGGEYVIKTATGEKKAGELTEQDIKDLKVAAETAPPTMEELAKSQLDTLTTIAGGILKLTTLPAKQAAGTYTADQLLGLAKSALPAINTSVSKVPDLTVKGGRENIDDLVKNGGSISKFIEKSSKDLTDVLINMGEEIEKLNKKFPLVGDIIDKYILQNSNPIRTGRDVLKMPGQDIQLLPEDSFAAFTKGSEVLQNMGGSNNRSSTTPTLSNSTIDLNHTLTVNINAPSHVNTEQLVSMFNDTGVSQALGIAVKEAFNNGGLTTSNPNKQQMLNSGRLQVS